MIPSVRAHRRLRRHSRLQPRPNHRRRGEAALAPREHGAGLRRRLERRQRRAAAKEAGAELLKHPRTAARAPRCGPSSTRRTSGGFRYAICLDADGQHCPDIPRPGRRSGEGARAAGGGRARFLGRPGSGRLAVRAQVLRTSGSGSSGPAVEDSQSGLPRLPACPRPCSSPAGRARYDFEVEVLLKAGVGRAAAALGAHSGDLPEGLGHPLSSASRTTCASRC